MADIIPIRRRKPVTPWALVTIQLGGHGKAYEVCASTGAPGALGVDRMFCGYRLTLREAATFAQAKAAQLGAGEIVDFTDAEPGPEEVA